MAKSKQHQEAHGIGQIEKQLESQAAAATSIQGESELDRQVTEASKSEHTELDEIIET